MTKQTRERKTKKRRPRLPRAQEGPAPPLCQTRAQLHLHKMGGGFRCSHVFADKGHWLPQSTEHRALRIQSIHSHRHLKTAMVHRDH